MNETQTSSATTAEEQNIKSLWTALRVAEGQLEKRGLQFGEAVYKLREKYKIQGTRNDLASDAAKLEGYFDVLNRLEIPEATARRWRNRYEEFIGTRVIPKPNPEPNPVEVEADPAEPEPPPPPRPTSTPAVLVTKAEHDIDSIRNLVKRLTGIRLTLEQVIDENKAKQKWSKYAEKFAEVVSAAKELANCCEGLDAK